VKAQSRKDALARTVRLLTNEGTAVTFRGATPFVAADPHTGKVVRLNLPEIPDEAPALLVDALQGYLDHEVGHIFYTPFDKIPDRRVDAERGAFANIFEDIRLEKLLPRDLPGTKDNLERMYVNWLPLIVQPMLDDVAKSGDPKRMISALLMPTMRALGGQKVFQQLMDEKGYWSIVEPLMQRLPGFGAQVAAMETYDDVLACVEKLKEALTPPPPPPAPPAPPEPEPEPEADEDSQDPGEGSDEDDSEGTHDDEPSETEPSEDEDAEGSEPGDDVSDDDTDEGEDGSPTNEDDDDAGDDSDAAGDDNADATEEGDGSGDDPADDAGDDEPGDSDGDEGEPEASDQPGDKPVPDADSDRDEGDRPDDADEPDAEDDAAPGEGGKRNRTMTEALGLLDPTLRRALFLHKKRKKSVTEIASELNVSADRVEEMLREARRGLAKLMKE